jgi:Putative transposase/Transposase zinc-binding domain
VATLAKHPVRRRHGEHRFPASGLASGWGAPRPVYRPRRPTQTPLYPVVQYHLETFLSQAAEADTLSEGVPAWVERDFRGYLECGILAYGFARARCEECGHERLIPFSCKGRGVCPSCNARRMCEVAAHLTDHVLPPLPTRQWVLSVPKRLRPYLQHDTRVAGTVLRIFLRAIRTTLRRASPSAPSGTQLGAVSFFHRFGSSLNVHPHFHLVVLDGVFSRSGAGDPDARFHEASDLSPAHVQHLEATVQHRVLRLFARRGLLDDADTDDMLTWQGSGGFSVDASVRIEGEDRAGIERLVRYCARPPFALERLHATQGSASLASPDSRLLYRFPKPDVHGRTEILLTPLELLQRLARFVPPPRVHRHRYHGVLAPNAKLRAQVVAIGRPELRAEAPKPDAEVVSPGPPSEPGPAPASPARIRWAVLLARIYEVLPLLCPACGSQMKILAFLTDPPVVRAILLHLDFPHRPPPLAPARGPPQIDFLTDPSDQTPGFDPAEPEPVPEFEFDQSVPDDFDFQA